MKFDFTDKVTLVTGASRGIGRSIAQMFAAAGMAGSVRDRELPPGRGAIELDRAREREQVGKMADAILAQLALDRSAIEVRGHEIRQHLESLEHSREATRKPERRLTDAAPYQT